MKLATIIKAEKREEKDFLLKLRNRILDRLEKEQVEELPSN